ncbi:CHAT domain-containing protein [Kitasatospora indigofera]|uniref:CHAT domain-containing protein n=1 Tax=Kitasatospora indigofera TaxID=67307 RepID=UPI0033BAC43F
MEAFHRNNGMLPLARAADEFRRALTMTPEDHPERAMLLNDLGVTLQLLAQWVREPPVQAQALAMAADAGRDAVATAAATGDPSRAAYLSNLAVTLRRQFLRTGDRAALTEAVACGRRAADLAAEAGDPKLGGYLNNLCLMLRSLSQQTAVTASLAEATEAVAVGRRSITVAVALGDPDIAAYLSNLVAALRALAERTDDTDLLAEALDTARRAVSTAGKDDPDRSRYLVNLANVLRAMGQQDANLDLLAESVDVARRVVALTPEDHPSRALRLNNLSGSLLALHEHAEEDHLVLEEAVNAAMDSVRLTPDDHPDHDAYLFGLGNALAELAWARLDPLGMQDALDCFTEVAENDAGTPLLRVKAYRRIAFLELTLFSAVHTSLSVVESAVELLPRINPRHLARSDREHRVGQLGSLAEAAVAAALGSGLPHRAVELLEATRGILAAGTIDARRDDLAGLRNHHPALAREFEDLRDRLERDGPSLVVGEPGGEAGDGPDAADLTRLRSTEGVDWEILVDRIRDVPGFSEFLAPPRIEDLSVQAGQGPIVYLIAGPTRCDALILTGMAADPVRTVQLEQLTQADVANRLHQLLTARQTAADTDLPPEPRTAAQEEILDVLAWLWDGIAEPVLNDLGFTTVPDAWACPRVWWCPVGIMGYLPVHAAGHHRDLESDDPDVSANPRTVLDRVISSYTPTVRALEHARSQPPVTADGTLIVSVPDAPGIEPLSGGSAECDVVHTFVPGALRPRRPVRADVLAALPAHPMAHFSCHGTADLRDPAESRLILHDHQSDPLTVADISALQLTGALAFLSACDTSLVSPRLVDEAVNLTGAFHLAGYQNVIGTLWPVNERAAMHITTGFYRHLTAGGTIRPDTANSARALHFAVRALRSRQLLAPTQWAAHTHTGT